MATKGVKESDALYNDKIYPAVSRLYETERYEPFIAFSDLRFHFLRMKLNLYKILKHLMYFVFCFRYEEILRSVRFVVNFCLTISRGREYTMHKRKWSIVMFVYKHPVENEANNQAM
jgi:hypothetical protein